MCTLCSRQSGSASNCQVRIAVRLQLFSGLHSVCPHQHTVEGLLRFATIVMRMSVLGLPVYSVPSAHCIGFLNLNLLRLIVATSCMAGSVSHLLYDVPVSFHHGRKCSQCGFTNIVFTVDSPPLCFLHFRRFMCRV